MPLPGNTNMNGEKGRRLEIMQRAGLPVPEFVLIDTERTAQDSGEEIATYAHTKMSAVSYAVRSSALIEDAQEESMAGKFLTKLDIAPEDLAVAIEEVRHDAEKKLGSLSEFSLIIQKYIPATFSGVAFTRNPNGEREMIIEFHEGQGDEVVGGMITPEREIFYRTQKEVTSKLPNILKGKTLFLEIEKLFDFPQDIEWCIQENEWCILQARPITSLTQERHEFLLRIEEELPKEGKYYFAKTSVCDVAPRPSRETFALLERLYEQDGPVDRAYRAYGVAYQETNFLKVIAGELYVDKEKELQSLFPAYSYFLRKEYAPRPVQMKGFLTSLKNSRALKKIEGNYEEIALQLRSALQKDLNSPFPEEIVQQFMKEYERIFTVNLLAEKAIRDLQEKLPGGTSLTEALSIFPEDMGKAWQPPEDIVGNTLDFCDTSSFMTHLQQQATGKILEGIPRKELKHAQEMLRLREYGRWTALRYVTKLRNFVPTEKEENEGELAPSVLTDTPFAMPSEGPLGVSGGKGRGEITRIPTPGGILVVSALTPDIAEHASMLEGVIADHGGLLSHFAIIAREMKLPVIVNYPIYTLKEGQEVEINGSTGEVKINSYI